MKKFVIVFLTAASMPAWAWGHYGHRTIGQLTESYLCEKAKVTAQQILQGQSLADVSTWADDVRPDPKYKYAYTWHFVDMPLASDYRQQPHNSRGDVVTAIAKEAALLKDSSADRLDTLRFLIHFVSDAHQPLHAGMKEDRGGNFFQVMWFGDKLSLHEVWDTAFFRKLGIPYRQLASDIAGEFKDKPVEQLAPEDWVNESSKIDAGIYPPSGNGIPVLGDEYFNANLPVVKQRVYEAARRLAELLNQTLGCG
jgi:hypothetical protein